MPEILFPNGPPFDKKQRGQENSQCPAQSWTDEGPPGSKDATRCKSRIIVDMRYHPADEWHEPVWQQEEAQCKKDDQGHKESTQESPPVMINTPPQKKEHKNTGYIRFVLVMEIK